MKNPYLKLIINESSGVDRYNNLKSNMSALLSDYNKADKVSKDDTGNLFLTELFNVEPNSDIIDFMKSRISLFSDVTFRKKFIDFIAYGEFDLSNVFDSLTKCVYITYDGLGESSKYSKGKSYMAHLQKLEQLSNIIVMAAVKENNCETVKTFTTSIYTYLGVKAINDFKKNIESNYDKCKDPETADRNAYELAGDYEEELDEAVLFLGEIETLFKDYNETIINEGVVSKVGDKAISAGEKIKDFKTENKVKEEKLGKWFDNSVNKKIDEIKNARKQQRYDQVVKGSLNVSREISRAFKTLPLNLLMPGVGYAAFIASIFVDKKIDKKYRAQIIGDLKLELKIIDEKISQAERNNDDKAKVELIRAKDQLERALERVTRGGFNS